MPPTVATRASRHLLASLPWLAALLGAFWPTLVWMQARFGSADSFYSHGWLVPLASAWLIWQRRDGLRLCHVRQSAAGLWLVLLFLALHVASTSLRLHVASGLAMVGVVWGLVWTSWGPQVLWALRAPLLFLLFMVPVPGVVLISWSFHLKLLAASMATQVATWVGLPATQAGSTILFPGLSVLIDDTCSGLRSLLTLVALATFWSAMMPRGIGWLRRGLLVSASVPIALFANVVRILLLILIAWFLGPQMAEGWLHYGSGFAVFGVALVLLAGISRLLGIRPEGRGR